MDFLAEFEVFTRTETDMKSAQTKQRGVSEPFRRGRFYFPETPQGEFQLDEKGWNTLRMKPGALENIYAEKLDDWHKINLLRFEYAEAFGPRKK